MQQIADWLKTLGMSEYADRFTQNRIDLWVLPELTDQHLKDLGIARSRAATALENAGRYQESYRMASRTKAVQQPRTAKLEATMIPPKVIK